MPLAVCLIVWFVAYFPTISFTASSWLESGAYSHGFVSLSLALYIAWHTRTSLVMRPRPNMASLAILLLASAAWWMGEVANVLKVEQVAAYLLLVMVFVAIFGWQALRTLQIPFIIIVLVLPVWDFLAGPLRELTTIVSQASLTAFGIPYLREGYLITLPAGRFLIEEGCSGLGFLLCATMLVVFFAYLNHLKWTHAATLLLVSWALAIFANWFRVVSILLIGTYAGIDHPMVADHLTYGWFVFLLLLIPFLVIMHWLAPHTIPDPAVESGHGPRHGKRAWGSALVICAILSLAPAFSYMQRVSGAVAPHAEWSLPEQIGPGIVRARGARTGWYPVFSGASRISSDTYIRDDGLRFALLAVHYDSQTQGRELINVENRLYDAGWNELSDEAVDVGQESVIIRIKTLTSGINDVRHIAYWYVVAGRATSDPVVAKALEVYGAVTGNRTASLLAISVDNEPDTSRLRSVVRSIHPGTRFFRPHPP